MRVSGESESESESPVTREEQQEQESIRRPATGVGRQEQERESSKAYERGRERGGGGRANSRLRDSPAHPPCFPASLQRLPHLFFITDYFCRLHYYLCTPPLQLISRRQKVREREMHALAHRQATQETERQQKRLPAVVYPAAAGAGTIACEMCQGSPTLVRQGNKKHETRADTQAGGVVRSMQTSSAFIRVKGLKIES